MAVGLSATVELQVVQWTLLWRMLLLVLLVPLWFSCCWLLRSCCGLGCTTEEAYQGANATTVWFLYEASL